MPTKDRERMLIGGAVMAALLMLLVGYFALISPQRSQTRSVQDQVADVTTQNTVLSNKITNLIVQNRDLAKYQAKLATDRQALPSSSGLPDFLRTLQSIGAETNTDASLTVSAPTDVTSLAGGTTGAAGAGPAIDGAHIYALPITAQVTGSVAHLEDFLTQLQSVQPRAVLISQITETAGTVGRESDTRSGLALTMQAFVAPSDKGEAASLAAAAQK